MKNILLTALAFILISSQASAWDSTISQVGGIVSVNGQLLKDSIGQSLPALTNVIATGTNGSTDSYWGGLPVDYFNVTPANANTFYTTPVHLHSPFFYYIPQNSTVQNRRGGLCIVTNGTEYRAILSGLTYIPGEGTQVGGCYEGSDYAPLGDIPSGFRLLQNGDGGPPSPPPPKGIFGDTPYVSPFGTGGLNSGLSNTSTLDESTCLTPALSEKYIFLDFGFDTYTIPLVGWVIPQIRPFKMMACPLSIYENLKSIIL